MMNHDEPQSLIVNLSLGIRRRRDPRHPFGLTPVKYGQGSDGDVTPGWSVENPTET